VIILEKWFFLIDTFEFWFFGDMGLTKQLIAVAFATAVMFACLWLWDRIKETWEE